MLTTIKQLAQASFIFWCLFDRAFKY